MYNPTEYTIDKSLFTAEELAQYEALVAKATVDPAANKKEMEEEDPPVVPPKKKKPAEKAEVDDPVETKKSAPEESPVVKAALDDLANLKKSFAMKEMTEVAKKYAALGKNETELAKTLYDMKETSEEVYKSYISILDESLALVEKSGLFAEIGKSAGGSVSGSSADTMAEAKAKEIMKADSSIDYDTAIAKACMDPDIMAAYDAEYYNR